MRYTEKHSQGLKIIRHGNSLHPVTVYFKLNAMAKRQMCRQATKMLQSYFKLGQSSSVVKHPLQYTKHCVNLPLKLKASNAGQKIAVE